MINQAIVHGKKEFVFIKGIQRICTADISCIIKRYQNEILLHRLFIIQIFKYSVIVDLVHIMFGKGQKLRIYHLVSLSKVRFFATSEFWQTPNFKDLNLDAHLVSCHLAGASELGGQGG